MAVVFFFLATAFLSGDESAALMGGGRGTPSNTTNATSHLAQSIKPTTWDQGMDKNLS